MTYSENIKARAISLRKRGYSIAEVSGLLKIAKGTSSVWLSSIILNEAAQSRLRRRKILGQYKSIETFRKKREKLLRSYEEIAHKTLSGIALNESTVKLLSSLLYWAEGAKVNQSLVAFINSDPIMIATFLSLMRKGFTLDEKKFRVLVHLHQYHDENNIKSFWSEVTKIPLSQFSKCYLKPNTKKRVRANYMGCARVSYYDHKIALELSSIYNVLAKNLGV